MADPVGVEQANLLLAMEVHATTEADRCEREALDLEEKAHMLRLRALAYRAHARVSLRHSEKDFT